MEIWKDIPGYEGYYAVSSFGKVKSYPRTHKTGNNGHRTRGGGIISQHLRNNYLFVRLHKGGVFEQVNVHRIVASVFVENEDNKPYVDHIDGNRLNNRFDNLRWVTPSENSNNAITKRRHFRVMQKFKGRMGVESLTHKAVLQYSKSGVFIKRWDCISDAARFYGINSSGISHVIRGDQNTCAGYIWKPVKEKECV